MTKTRLGLAIAAILGAVAVVSPLSAQNPIQIYFGTAAWSTAASGVPKVGIVDSAGATFTANSGRLPVLADINNGSVTVTEAATLTANQASVALTDSVLYAYDGTTDSRLRSRAGLINSADVGLVTRPFVPSDGTNTQPTMDAAARPGFVKHTDGTNTAVIDPCQGQTKSFLAISQATSTQLITGTAAKKIYICSIFVNGSDAENLSLVAGTGSVCATSTVAVIGATTAANGNNLAAGSGYSHGNGASAVAATTVNQDNLCLLQSGTGRVAGTLSYVVQ